MKVFSISVSAFNLILLVALKSAMLMHNRRKRRVGVRVRVGDISVEIRAICDMADIVSVTGKKLYCYNLV